MSIKGLVAHYKLDGNARDSTPYCNHGTVTGATGTTDRKGKANGAMAFAGGTDHINCGNNVLTNVVRTQASWSFWINRTSYTGGAGLLRKWTPSVGNRSWFMWETTNDRLEFYGSPDGTNATRNIASANNLLEDGRWIHIVVTYNAGAVVFYKDGVSFSAGSMVCPQLFNNVNIPFLIGIWSSTSFNGAMDDVRIYDRALSADEIKALYESYDPRLSLLDKGLVGHWKLDGDGRDSTPYSNHGTVTEATATTDRKGKDNGAMDFQGTTSNINCGTHSRFIFGANPHSFSGWINPTEEPVPYRYIVAVGYPSTGAQSGLGVTNSRHLFLSAFAAPLITTTYALPSINQWYHLAVVYNGTSALFYVDGDLKETINIALNVTTGRCRISYNVNDASPWKGYLDDVRIYNRALSAPEVKALYESYESRIAIGEKGLVGHWKLDNDYKDSTPYSVHGTSTSAPTATTDRKGRANSAFTFNGTNNHIRIANSTHLQLTTAITAMCWVKGEALSSSERIFSKYDINAAQMAWSISTGITGNTNKLRIVLSNDGRYVSETAKDYSSSIVAFNNTWHHVAFTFTANTLKLYVDGAEDTNLTLTLNATVNTLYNSTAYTMIGSALNNNSPSNFFNGQIDSAKIYNRALTAEEIKKVYESYNPRIS